mgnify:CR=1 FL=1
MIDTANRHILRKESYMSVEYLGFSEVNGPLVILEGVSECGYEEIVEINFKQIPSSIDIF